METGTLRRACRRAPGLVAVAALAALAAAVARPARAGDRGSDPDAAVRRLIARLREPAHRLRVDGRDGDWDGFPAVEDARRDTTAGAARDIVSVALAVRDTDVVVLVRTAAPPDPAEAAFALDVDFLGLSARDAEIRIAPGGTSAVRAFPERAAAMERATSLVDAKVGSVLEVRVPLLVVASWMPVGAGEEFLRGTRRPWVRVQARSLDASGRVADEGPAVAAYRLGPEEAPLDGPPPREAKPARAVSLPVDGRWFVRQGGFALWSHADHWAYDLSMVDATLSASPGSEGKRKEEFLAWGRPVRAPEAARVVVAHAEEDDRDPADGRAALGRGTRSNQVVVAFEDGLRMYLEHLGKGSVPVEKGGDVAAGEVLGRVGNSGASGAPHLHVALHDRPGEFTGLPMALCNVRVSLNAAADDPWARELSEWEVREGLFVERLQAFTAK